MTATSKRLTIPRFRNTTRSNSPAVFPHNLGGAFWRSSLFGRSAPPPPFCFQITPFAWKEAPDYERPWPPQWRIRPHRGNGHSTNDRVCWFGDGVSCASDFHLRFYGRFADLHKLHALHARLSRSARKVNGLMVKIASAVIAKECNVRKEPSCFFRQLPSGGRRWPVHAVLLDGGGLVVRCRARVREAAFPYTFYFRDGRSTILNFAFDAVASDRWISAFLAWPLLSTTSIPRRVSGCAVTSLRASLLDRCWCAAGCLWRAARGDTR